MKNRKLPTKKNWIGGLDLSDSRNSYTAVATKKYSIVARIYRQMQHKWPAHGNFKDESTGNTHWWDKNGLSVRTAEKIGYP